MNYMKQFLLSFSGLSERHHDYEFEIGEKFFEALDFSEIKHGDVHVDLGLHKHSTMLVLTFSLNGYVTVQCDRCADDYPQEVEGEYRLIVKFGDHAEEESEEIIMIPATDHEIDVSQFIYEYIMLALPLKKEHPDDEDGNSMCDEETLRKLNEISVRQENGDDPRWDALKGLK